MANDALKAEIIDIAKRSWDDGFAAGIEAAMDAIGIAKQLHVNRTDKEQATT